MFKKLRFSIPLHRPFFYTSFVSTLDGKVWVNKPGYWPIGSNVDYQYFTFLRTHADTIVDGKNTALTFGQKTIETLHKKEFQRLRKKLGKKNNTKYVVVTSKLDKQLVISLKNPYSFKPIILTTDKVVIDEELEKISTIAKVGNGNGRYVTVSDISTFLHKEQLGTVFIDGGPTLIASFLEDNLLDEVFLTVSPKIFGSDGKNTLTMVEGKLFPPNKVKSFSLISMIREGNEVFLRYRKV